MKTIDDGGPAFPRAIHDQYDRVNDVLHPEHGMSLREYFAAKALQGFCANPAIFAANGQCGWKLVNCTEADLAGYCHSLADSMLAASKSPKQ